MEALGVPGLLFFGAVIVLSYAVRGGAGFGGATVALLALVMSVKTVAPMVTFLGLISSFIILYADHGHVVWPALVRILPWCAAGFALGLYLFALLDASALGRALGVFVLGYGVFAFGVTLRLRRALALPERALRPVAGALAGFVGTLFGANAGMFFAIYLDQLAPAKRAFRATIAAVLAALGLLRGAGYVAVGAYDSNTLLACALALPLMAIGAFLGNHIHAHLEERPFRRFVAGVLIASGAALILR